MARKLNCPECGASLVVPDGVEGHDIRCPSCLADFPVPEGDAPPARRPEDEPPLFEGGVPFPSDHDRDRDEQPRRQPRGEPRPYRRRRRPPPPPKGRGALFWLAIVFGTLILGGFACCGGGYMLLPGEKWHRHESPEGGFAVDLPAPVKKDMPIPGYKPEPGQKVEGTILWKRGEFYAVTYMDILPASQRAVSDEGLLDEVEKEMRGDPEAKVVRVERVKVSGFPAREIEYLFEDGGTYVGRFIVADRRLYGIVAGGRFVRPGNANVRRFLDSFEVTDPLLRAEGVRRQEQELKEVARKEARERAERENEAFRSAPHTGPKPGDPRALATRSDDVVYFSCDEAVKDGVGRWGSAPVLMHKASTGTGVRGNAAYLTRDSFSGHAQLWLGEVPSADRPLGTTGYTLSGWYRTRSHSLTVLRLWPQGDFPTPVVKRGTLIMVNERDVRAVMTDNTGTSELTAPRPADDNWHHVALVCTAAGTGATAELYLDGTRVANGPGRLVKLPGANIGFGKFAGKFKGGPDLAPGTAEWIAALDECCLFPRPLEAADIRKLAGQEPLPERALKRYGPEFRTPFPVPDPKAFAGLKHHFPFDQVEGGGTRDAVAGETLLMAHDAELVAGPRGAAVRITGPTGYQKESWGIRSKFGLGPVDVGMPIGVGEGKPVTLAFWVRTDESGKTQPDPLIWFSGPRSHGSGSSNNHFFAIGRAGSGDEIKLNIAENPSSSVERKVEATRPGIKPGEWAHIAVARDEKGALRWAINGEVEAIKKNHDGSLLIGRLLIGSAYQNHSGGFRTAIRFNAEFADFCIFDRALSDDELAGLAGRKAMPKR